MQNKDYDTTTEIYEHYNYDCFICECYNKANQLAHIISNSKSNRKKYGSKIIDHELNVLPACNLEHNGLIDIGHNIISCDYIASIITSDLKKESKRLKIELYVKENIKRKLKKRLDINKHTADN